MASAAPTDALDLSVVVPAFNEGGRIAGTVLALARHVDQVGLTWELIVVDDGSSDDTADLVRGLCAADPRVTLLRLPRNLGKGAAVRAGMLAARGARRLFSDADLSTPPGELSLLWRALDEGADIAIASRGLRSSDLRVRQSALREGMGRTFNLLVRGLALRGLSDTQCGFKLFRGAAAEHVFAQSELDGFAFDVEVLSLARRAGLVVREIPVEWAHRSHSKVSPWLDSARMLRDLLKVRRRLGRR